MKIYLKCYLENLHQPSLQTRNEAISTHTLGSRYDPPEIMQKSL